MKKLIAIAAMIAAFGLGGAAAFAASTDKPANPGGGNDGQVCPNNDTGHISASTPSVTATAPDGKLISGYCVKAGSANQGLGPEFVTVDPAQKSVTITHSSGKDISHYSLIYVDEGGETTTETTETTETETTETETTETETTVTETTETTPTTPETTTTETTTQTTTTETTTESSTPEDPPAEEDVEEQQSDPVVQVKSAQVESQSGPAAVVAPARATKPSKAAQPAPLTP
ncbi:MAG TPA: hypothetical protein VJ807_04750 [Gaiellaceae bacterium]|nr:hypothetical protein [Gaiellaceae bacterium]